MVRSLPTRSAPTRSKPTRSTPARSTPARSTPVRAAAGALALALLAAAVPAPVALAAGGAEPVDLEMVTKIRDEGFRRSQVMATAAHLTDVIGPRLTGSAGQREANEWTRAKLAEWGLRSWIEEFEFGEGWTFRRAEVRMTAPAESLLPALPEAWTPGTAGPVTGAAVRAKLETEEDLEKQKGKLAGKIVFLDDPRTADQPPTGREAVGGDGDFRRWDDAGLSELGIYEIPEDERGGGWTERARKRWDFAEKLHAFLVEEKAVALVGLSSRDHGIVRLGGGGSRGMAGRSRGIPSVVMAAEPYHRVLRLLDEGEEVTLSIDVEAEFDDAGRVAHNTLAEIPGADLAGEVVLAGAHLDSWHAGTGATDNAAGVAVVMEAVRILKALGVQPRRTIRVGLWTGEEQGLLGARAYVDEHLADRPETTDPEELKLPRMLRTPTWPIHTKPGHATFSAYFNLDNGGGKIRGIYAQENAAVRPIFEAWLEPFADLGATTVTLRSTGGTDHLPFDRVGLPGFQFIQDGLDYWSRTHHTHIDTYEHLHEADLKQASVVMASFLYHAATRDELLPRKPMPQEPPEDPKKEKKEGEAKEGAE